MLFARGRRRFRPRQSLGAGVVVQFPDGCADDTDFMHCRGTCPLLDYRVDNLTDDQVYNLGRELGLSTVT